MNILSVRSNPWRSSRILQNMHFNRFLFVITQTKQKVRSWLWLWRSLQQHSTAGAEHSGWNILRKLLPKCNNVKATSILMQVDKRLLMNGEFLFFYTRRCIFSHFLLFLATGTFYGAVGAQHQGKRPGPGMSKSWHINCECSWHVVLRNEENKSVPVEQDTGQAVEPCCCLEF